MNFPPTIVAHFMPQQYTAHSTLKTTKQSVSVEQKKIVEFVHVCARMRMYTHIT